MRRWYVEGIIRYIATKDLEDITWRGDADTAEDAKKEALSALKRLRRNNAIEWYGEPLVQ